MMDAREAAAFYISKGLRPIPLLSVDRAPPGTDDKDKGKIPRDKKWADRTRPYRSEEFTPGDNLALAMGRMPNGKWLVGLDFDDQVDRSHLFPMPETMITKTPRGWHLIYTVPAYTYLGNWVKVGGVMDVKYARGALVAAPSRTMGGEYETLYREPTPLPTDILRWIYMQRQLAGFRVSGSWKADGGKQP